MKMTASRHHLQICWHRPKNTYTSDITTIFTTILVMIYDWIVFYYTTSIICFCTVSCGGENYEQVGRERLRDSEQKTDGWKGSPVFPSWVMWTVLAAISCSHTNKALVDLIKIHARKMEADGFRKGYLCVCVTAGKNENMREKESRKERVRERERGCMCSLMLEINDEN